MEKSVSETLQTAPAQEQVPVQKRRRQYGKMSITPIFLETENDILQGSVTSNNITVSDAVNVTDFGNDDTWSSEKFDVDFEF